MNITVRKCPSPYQSKTHTFLAEATKCTLFVIVPPLFDYLKIVN